MGEKKFMNKWICRILILIFLVNTMPVEVFARKTSFNFQKLSDIVINYDYDMDNMSVAQIDEYLQSEDLSPRERAYLELQRKIAEKVEEAFNALGEGALVVGKVDEQGNPIKTRGGEVAKVKLGNPDPILVQQQRAEYLRIYDAIINSPAGKNWQEQQKTLEKEEALSHFYKEAQSEGYVAAAIYALRTIAEKKALEQKQAEEIAKQEEAIKLVRQPKVQTESTAVRDTTTGNEIVRIDTERKLSVLEAWEQNLITVEDLMEYVDPGITSDQKPDLEAMSDAAQLLWYYFLDANMHRIQYNREDSVWLALRLKYRIKHQLFNLQQHTDLTHHDYFVQACGNLLLLSMQVQVFLNENYTHTDALAAKDRELEEYDVIYDELNRWGKNVWNYADVTEKIVNEVIKAHKAHPAQNSKEYQLLSENISFLTGYLLFLGDNTHLNLLLRTINRGDTQFHNYDEAFVSEFFSSLFQTFILLPIDPEEQHFVRQLLICAAAPICRYGNSEAITNAVNVRVQALAVASMFRQSSKVTANNVINGTKKVQFRNLKTELFNDEQFRTKMAGYVVDVYAPITQFNTRDVKRYGLAVDTELVDLADSLSDIFETFLPVKHPASQWMTVQAEGPYKGCQKRIVDEDPAHWVLLNDLNLSRHGAVGPARGMGEHGLPCRDIAPEGYDTILVLDSNQHAKFMAAPGRNPNNRNLAEQDFIIREVLPEVVLFGAWGLIAKVLKWGLRALATFARAAKAARIAKVTHKGMRFSTKYKQLSKFQTNQWLKDVNITNISRSSRNKHMLSVEISQTGMRSFVIELPAKAFNPKTLRGRVRIHNAALKQLRARGTTAEELLTPAAKRSIGTMVEVTPGVFEKVTVPTAKVIEMETKVARSAANYEQALHQLGSGISRPLAHPPHSHLEAYSTSVGWLPNGQIAGTSAGLTFSYRLLGQFAPVFGQGKGLLKFVLAVKALDPLGQFIIKKGFEEPNAKQLHERYVKSSGLKQPTKQEAEENEKKKKEYVPSILEKVQSLYGPEDNSFASISAYFMGMNYLINKGMDLVDKVFDTNISPVVQSARRGIYGMLADFQERTNSALPANLSETLKEYITLPVTVATMPIMLNVGDNTPAPDDEALRLRYVIDANEQRISRSMEGHEKEKSKERYDEEIAKIVSDKDSLEIIQNAIPQISKYQKDFDKVYDQYIADLQKAKELIDTDPTAADNLAIESSKNFVSGRTRLLTQAIRDNLAQEMPNKTQEYIQNLEQIYGEFFTDEDKNLIEKICKEYYKGIEPLEISFYTAVTDNQWKVAEEKRNKVADAFNTKYSNIVKTVDQRFKQFWLPQHQQNIMRMLEEKATFLDSERKSGALPYLEGGMKKMEACYDTYEQGLDAATKQAEEDDIHSALSAFYKAEMARETYLNTKSDLMTQAVNAWITQEIAKRTEEMNKRSDVPQETKQLILEQYKQFFLEYQSLLIEWYDTERTAYKEKQDENLLKENTNYKIKMLFQKYGIEANGAN